MPEREQSNECDEMGDEPVGWWVPTMIATETHLRWSLFRTDPDVIAHVDCVAERADRRDAAMARAYERGDAGDSPEWQWWVRAADRAKAMMGGG